MTFAPCVVMFSSAVTWLALSVSVLPEAVSSLTLSFLACACAPSFIFTKNGFVSVLVMRPMVTSLFLSELPPAAAPAVIAAAGHDTDTERRDRRERGDLRRRARSRFDLPSSEPSSSWLILASLNTRQRFQRFGTVPASIVAVKP